MVGLIHFLNGLKSRTVASLREEIPPVYSSFSSCWQSQLVLSAGLPLRFQICLVSFHDHVNQFFTKNLLTVFQTGSASLVDSWLIQFQIGKKQSWKSKGSCYGLLAPYPVVSMCTHRLKSDRHNVCIYVPTHIHTCVHTHTCTHIKNSMFPNTQTLMFNRSEIFDRFNDLTDQMHQQNKTTQLETGTQQAHFKE